MVRNLETNKPVFMVFDALVVNGDGDIAFKNLSERLQKIGKEVIQPYREAIDQQKTGSVPFSIIGKAIYPKKSIEQLLSRIKNTTHGRIYTDEKRRHYTDGIIFTPDGPYSPMGTHNLFKWKFIDRISIDFKLQYNNKQRKYILYCRGNDSQGDLQCRDADFTEEDFVKVNRDLQEMTIFSKRYTTLAHNNDSNSSSSTSNNNMMPTPIVEMSYDRKNGHWKYHGIRRDKNKANHLTVVFDTFESIAENITEDELKSVCVKSSSSSSSSNSHHK
eukprot:TRINITY_DN8988_c0_g1_i1.p1 TRINITY_DN8988_c0_g1~~TRINITY_DN8988_c0_g1_i1.p1  ORF type:complete len:283 (-),score=80.40 TRINITY_DN8988_c0_g1_i1:122-943(-)